MPQRCFDSVARCAAHRGSENQREGFRGNRQDQRIAVIDIHLLRALHGFAACIARLTRSEEHTSELQSLMRISYDVFCLKKTKTHKNTHTRASKCNISTSIRH